MAHIAINGKPLDCSAGQPIEGHLIAPIEDGADLTLQDLDSAESGRNQIGDMLRDRVAQDKVKCKLTFPPMSTQELAALLKEINGVSFDFSYPDPLYGSGLSGHGSETITASCYAGDRSLPMKKIVDGKPVWTKVSFSVIEN